MHDSSFFCYPLYCKNHAAALSLDGPFSSFDEFVKNKQTNKIHGTLRVSFNSSNYEHLYVILRILKTEQ